MLSRGFKKWYLKQKKILITRSSQLESWNLACTILQLSSNSVLSLSSIQLDLKFLQFNLSAAQLLGHQVHVCVPTLRMVRLGKSWDTAWWGDSPNMVLLGAGRAKTEAVVLFPSTLHLFCSGREVLKLVWPMWNLCCDITQCRSKLTNPMSQHSLKHLNLLGMLKIDNFYYRL